MYVPALRWRQGEYQALLELTDPVKNQIVPLITIPDIEYDFEEKRPKKSIQDHVYPFANRYQKKWDKRPAWLSVHKNILGKLMDNGKDIFTHVFDELRMLNANAIPAIPLRVDAVSICAVKAIVKQDNRGIAILIRLEDLMKPDLKACLQTLALGLDAEPSDIDLIIDLSAPNFEPYDAFANVLIMTLRKIGDLNIFRNFILIGTAIPETFKDVAKGIDEIPRHDWLFYQTLIAKLPADMRQPNFGDYTIVHPEFTPVDMRKIKSSGKIIYTAPQYWSVYKGGAFRENPEQMHNHCSAIVDTAIFKGSGYSSGDDYIAKCARREEGPGNQTTWKKVAINHHITQAVDELATFCAVS